MCDKSNGSSILNSYPSIPENSLWRILITGGCGFIGLNLIKFFIKKGYTNIRILDNLSIGTKEALESVVSELGSFKKSQKGEKITYTLTPNPSALNPSILKLIIGDIRNRETCLKATEGVDAIIHLAAQAGVISSIENPYFDFETNAFGALNVLSASVENSVDKFIFASSNAPLGEQTSPVHEGKIPGPLSPYGASKLAGEGYCSAFFASYGLKTISFRFSNVYGPHCLHKNSVVTKFIKDGLTKGVLTIYGDGTQTRDFIHVEDLCCAIHSLLTPHSLLLTNDIWGHTFHLGTGKETSIIELASYVRELFRGDVKIFFESERKGEIKRNCSDIGKASKMLGFNPEIELKDGVKKVFDWFFGQGEERIKYAEVKSGSE